ncbi:MAG: exo-alpha-sialidase [Clostridia bacterium]|nr:exo-alpha-sialidase [Clostridia bacterium]
MQLLRKAFIFETNTPSCHAATLALTRRGIAAAWFGGTREGDDDVQIYFARCEDVFTKPVCVSAPEAVPHWNPVLFDADGALLLFYKRGKPIAHWQTMLCRSDDGGLTWSEPTLLVEGDDGGRGPVKNKPIRLKNGCILAPASTEQGPWRCFTDLSRDGGRTWERSADVPMPDESVGVIQPSLWEDAAGVHMLMRSNAGFIWRADSPDGMHWGTAYPTALPNNNSGLDLVQICEGHLILCCNPVEKNWGARTPLTLFESTDGGGSFRRLLDLETEPGEYSYPSVIYHDGILHGTYTWRREKIVYFEAEV